MAGLRDQRKGQSDGQTEMNDEAIQAQVDEWFEKADANNDGKLSLAEASEYICVWIMTEYAIEGEQDKIAEIFD